MCIHGLLPRVGLKGTTLVKFHVIKKIIKNFILPKSLPEDNGQLYTMDRMFQKLTNPSLWQEPLTLSCKILLQF